MSITRKKIEWQASLYESNLDRTQDYMYITWELIYREHVK